MCWQCEHYNCNFSKSYALSQHISQKHPYYQETTNQIISDEQIDDDIWNLPEYNSNYDSGTENDSDDSIIYKIKFDKKLSKNDRYIHVY